MESAICVLTAIRESIFFKKPESAPEQVPGRNDANSKVKQRSVRVRTSAMLYGSPAVVVDVVNPSPPAPVAGSSTRKETSAVKFRCKDTNCSHESQDEVLTETKVTELGLKKLPSGENSKNNFDTTVQPEVNEDVVKRLGLLMSSWETLLHQDQNYRDLVKERLRAKFHAGDYVVDAKGNGLSLWVRHKPMELISDMFCGMLLELIAGDMGESVEMGMRLKKVLTDPEVYQSKKFQKIYHYLGNILIDFISTMFLATETQTTTPGGSSSEDADVDWNLHLQLKNNLSLLSWLMEHTLKRSKEWTLVGFPDASEIFDVEWLIEFAGVLRDRRQLGPLPHIVSAKEKEYVSRAMIMEPENPFVILAALDIISAKKKLLTHNFETACRNLVQRFPQSAYIHLRIAKFYLAKGRNRKIAAEHLRRAVTINPTYSEVNLLCAKYICGKMRKIDLGVKYRDAFIRLAMTTDLSSYEAAIAYFSNALGTKKSIVAGYPSSSLFDTVSQIANRANLVVPDSDNGASGSSLHPTSATVSGIMSRYGERYNLSVQIILGTSYALAWPDEVRSKLLLFSVLNFYVVSEFGGALEGLLEIYQKNTVITIIKNLDFYREKFDWDNRLNFVAFRNWLVVEYEDILEMELEERLELRQHRAVPAEGSEDSDPDGDVCEEDEDMNGSNQNDDDPIKKMLIELLQIL